MTTDDRPKSRKEYMRAWRAAHREHLKDYERARKATPEYKEANREWSKTSRERHPEKYREAKREQYQSNKGQYSRRNRESRGRRVALVHEKKAGGCLLCGECRHPAALDLHH